jgi:hypothetical protein
MGWLSRFQEKTKPGESPRTLTVQPPAPYPSNESRTSPPNREKTPPTGRVEQALDTCVEYATSHATYPRDFDYYLLGYALKMGREAVTTYTDMEKWLQLIAQRAGTTIVVEGFDSGENPRLAGVVVIRPDGATVVWGMLHPKKLLSDLYGENPSSKIRFGTAAEALGFFGRPKALTPPAA